MPSSSRFSLTMPCRRFYAFGIDGVFSDCPATALQAR